MAVVLKFAQGECFLLFLPGLLPCLEEVWTLSTERLLNTHWTLSCTAHFLYSIFHLHFSLIFRVTPLCLHFLCLIQIVLAKHLKKSKAQQITQACNPRKSDILIQVIIVAHFSWKHPVSKHLGNCNFHHLLHCWTNSSVLQHHKQAFKWIILIQYHTSAVCREPQAQHNYSSTSKKGDMKRTTTSSCYISSSFLLPFVFPFEVHDYTI